jgi:autoinducer 2-degrading protein
MQSAAAQSTTAYINAVDLDIAPAEIEKFKVAIKENAAASMTEPGCRQFDVLFLQSDPHHVFLYEVYNDEAAFKAHRASAHFNKCMAIIGPMVVKREARPMGPIAFNSKSR